LLLFGGAAGERFVVEAKEDASYDLVSARIEMESARKNRQASSGVFVFSSKTVAAGQGSFLRQGQDVFISRNAEDPQTDVVACVQHKKEFCTTNTFKITRFNIQLAFICEWGQFGFWSSYDWFFRTG
jgi:hypothetical protein